MPDILLGVTGSVAATLTKKMVNALSELGYVHVVPTKNACYFFDAGDLPFHKCNVYRDDDEWWLPRLPGVAPEKKWEKKGDPVVHIELREKADVIVLAPLTANTMAKICAGICDNLLTSIVRAWDCKTPVVFAPAMNTFMWKRGLTTNQVFDLRVHWGWHLVPPIAKELACGDDGEGAMARIEDIVAQVKEVIE